MNISLENNHYQVNIKHDGKKVTRNWQCVKTACRQLQKEPKCTSQYLHGNDVLPNSAISRRREVVPYVLRSCVKRLSFLVTCNSVSCQKRVSECNSFSTMVLWPIQTGKPFTCYSRLSQYTSFPEDPNSTTILCSPAFVRTCKAFFMVLY
jgi:hypothetical protein